MFIAESPLIGCWVQAYSKHNFPTSTIDCCTALQKFNRSSTLIVLSFKETTNYRNQFRRIPIWIRQLTIFTVMFWTVRSFWRSLLWKETVLWLVDARQLSTLPTLSKIWGRKKIEEVGQKVWEVFFSYPRPLGSGLSEGHPTPPCAPLQPEPRFVPNRLLKVHFFSVLVTTPSQFCKAFFARKQ